MQTPSEQRFTPLELETRPTVDTAAYSYYMHIAEQTARIHACKETGPIRPIRIPGLAKLQWPTSEIRRVLGVQGGFTNLSFLAFAIGSAALVAGAFSLLLPELCVSMDWSGLTMLCAGAVGGHAAPVKQFYKTTPFHFVKVGDLEVKAPGECSNPEAEKHGRNIGQHILENAARGHDQGETIELVADALERCEGLLPNYRVDVLTAVAMELVPVLRAGLGLQVWPSFGQKVTTK